jgi:hypothetical protein
MKRAPECHSACQYALDVGMWPEHQCAGECQYPGQDPCPHCFESSGYMGRVHAATWWEPAWEDADPTRPCPHCNATGVVDSPLVTLDDLEELAADEADVKQAADAVSKRRA